VPIENEVKLGVPPAFRLPPLDDVCPGVTAVARPDLVLHATYFDTSDLRLTRAGASLRYRSNDGWTVKLPTDGTHEGTLLRNELRFDGASGAPPNEALDLVRGYARAATVGAVSRLRTLRRTVDLFDENGDRVAEIDDDEVSVLDGRRVGARFREVEIELLDEAASELRERVVTALCDAGAGDPDPVPKVVRALGPRALQPPDVEPLTVRDDATVAEVIRAAIVSSVHRLIVHDAGVRLGDDAEALHQARVATRRLRSDLRTFRDYLEPEWTRELRDELKWLGGELGTVRDGDVLVERLETHAGRLPADEHLIVERVVARRHAERDDARDVLLDGYRGPRYLELLERLVAATRAPQFVTPPEDIDAIAAANVAGIVEVPVEAAAAAAADEPPDVDASARDALPSVVRKPWGHLRRAVDALGDDPPDTALHDVRKRAKRCRYAAEAVAPVVGKRAREFAKAVANVQDVLGEHQDAVVAREWLGKAAADAPSREAYAAGMLSGIELGAAATARDEFPAAWHAAARKRLRSWL
jgi:CHAD domain-containing protein